MSQTVYTVETPIYLSMQTRSIVKVTVVAATTLLTLRVAGKLVIPQVKKATEAIKTETAKWKHE